MVSSLDRFQSIDPALLDIGPNDRVIDLGCGTGRHVLELSKSPGLVHGADISRHDLRIARYLLEIMRRRGEVQAKVHWLQMAGERLPFSDGAFDRVICTETLEHVDDDSVLARELVRVLKPGGILAVSVPDEFSEKVFWKLSKNYRTHAGGHVRIYERERIVALLREAGLRPYAVRYRHSLETAYWLSHVAFWSDWGKQGPITRVFRSALDSHRARSSRIVTMLDDIGNRILPKSIVVYSRKPLDRAPSTNGHARPAMTIVDTTRHEFGAAGRTATDNETADDRTSVEVRAVPAPFTIVPPSDAAAREHGSPPPSLRDELSHALGLEGDPQKRRLIEILRSCRFSLMREVLDVTGEQASTPTTADGRTVKEIFGHMTGWERWTVAALDEIAVGVQEPAIMTLSGYPGAPSTYGSIDAFNAARMIEARERPWQQIVEESSQAFEALIAAIDRVPAAALAATAPFYWPDLGGTVPCGVYLLMVSAHHYQEEHLPELQRTTSTR
jgi:ubiquinone/menaquinone biosynthesis C-methylase UbiE